MGRQFSLEVCEHDKWIALPPVHDVNCLAFPVCDANYLDVYTVHTGRWTRVGKTRAKRLDGDPRSRGNCRYIYSVLAVTAAITQPLSWLTQQPWQQIRYIRSSHGWPSGHSHEAAVIRAFTVKLRHTHLTKQPATKQVSRGAHTQCDKWSQLLQSHYLQIWGERAWTCHLAYVLLPYSKLSLKKHFATLGTPTRQRVCYSSVSGQGDCNMQGAQQLLHPQAQYVSFLPARNLQSPNMEGRCSSSFRFSWNECMHMKVFLVVGPLMSTPFRPSPLCVSNGQRHQLLWSDTEA